MDQVTYLLGNSLDKLKELEAGSVYTCVTSPPYWGLRDYGTATWEGGEVECEHNPQRPDGGQRSDRTLPLGRGGVYRDTCAKCGAIRIDSQLGLERTPEEYVTHLVEVFREVRRVLRDDGTLWLNLGDSYSGTGGQGYQAGNLVPSGFVQKRKYAQEGQLSQYNPKRGIGIGSRANKVENTGLKAKDLIGIPWRVAFALQADGWYLRSDIIWHKPNPMPESVTDRPTKSHEYIFLLSKSSTYYYDYDAIREPSMGLGKTKIRFGGNKYGDSDDPKYATKSGNEYEDSGWRNKRTVWTVNTKPYSGAHFATFPKELIEPCILAGCPVGGTVLDPFGGSGTVAEVAVEHGRNAILIELNPAYQVLQKERLSKVQVKLNVA